MRVTPRVAATAACLIALVAVGPPGAGAASRAAYGGAVTVAGTVPGAGTPMAGGVGVAPLHDHPVLQGSGVSQAVQRYVAVNADAVALVGVKVMDGTGGPSRENQTIVIEGDRITAVGPRDAVEVPAGAEVLELDGHTVIPGLVGLHDHSYYTAAGGRSVQMDYSGPRLYLASGVTTIRTTGSRAPYIELNLKEEIDAGNIPGPRMFVTGPYLTGRGGSMTMTRLSGPEDARRVVRYWAEEGVSWFKAYTQITREELGAAIDEAHANGIEVTAHLCSVTYREAVELGIDNLEHGLMASSDFHPGKEPDVCPPDFRGGYAELDIQGDEVQDLYRLMVENDVPMTSTLAVYENFVAGRGLEERALEMMAPEVREAVVEANRPYAAGESGYPPELWQKVLEFEYGFVQAGGLLAAGVDPTGYGGALPGFGDQRNYELLLEADFTPAQVIQILTANGARVLGIDDEVGTVEAGKLADLVVIDGDPETTPAEIRNVTLVFKEGLGFDSARILDDVRGQVGVR